MEEKPMNAYLETLAPLALVFLASALVGALGIFITTVWLAIAGGFRQDTLENPFDQKPSKRVFHIFLAGDGFMLAFGVAGMALRQLLEAQPLWAVLGAVGAGAMLVGLILSGMQETDIKR
jgi:hypothetical protein